MRKRKESKGEMDIIHFDAVLKKALIDDLLDEYSEASLSAERQNIPFSRNYLEQRKRMLINPSYFQISLSGYTKVALSGYAKVIRIIAFTSLILFMAMAAGATLLP